MVSVICPTCGSNTIILLQYRHNFQCLACENKFDKEDAVFVGYGHPYLHSKIIHSKGVTHED
jgi:hypothetical protein